MRAVERGGPRKLYLQRLLPPNSITLNDFSYENGVSPISIGRKMKGLLSAAVLLLFQFFQVSGQTSATCTGE